ncbi:hypothetical protein [Paenibacillus eucommiae]|uniref:Uncharacterized protein n=1 Tax=Paenibacillus eucommiae TaxID=1355755 RepID=A0ABS4IPD1_9BACL|nr:hypothetical protein [Paenibacillus eucommiae]MBP1988891.1 hypothetical protein [Paenibacillus eucommiae]
MKITENNVVQQIQNKNENAIPFIIKQYGVGQSIEINNSMYTIYNDVEITEIPIGENINSILSTII